MGKKSRVALDGERLRRNSVYLGGRNIAKKFWEGSREWRPR